MMSLSFEKHFHIKSFFIINLSDSQPATFQQFDKQCSAMQHVTSQCWEMWQLSQSSLFWPALSQLWIVVGQPAHGGCAHWLSVSVSSLLFSRRLQSSAAQNQVSEIIYAKLSIFNTSRQDKMAILGKILPILCSFSAYGTPSAIFKPTCLWNLPFSLLFLPIFCLKRYPILVINSNMEPICYFSARMFTDSAYFPPIFYLFSA